jgi:hypothetical protein
MVGAMKIPVSAHERTALDQRMFGQKARNDASVSQLVRRAALDYLEAVTFSVLPIVSLKLFTQSAEQRAAHFGRIDS